MPARITEVPRGIMIPCDDTFSCPEGSTCCRTASGEWGCCPTEKAVCCPDHVHCCPNGYICNIEQKSCTRGGEEIPFLSKTQTYLRKGLQVWQVTCDDKLSCPNGNTCCTTASGSWNCCPVEKAMCCSDYIHCCPNGYHCSVVQEICLRGDVSVPWYTKVPAQVKETLQGWEVPCDDTSSCPDGSTCCRAASGDWACCPILKAVCCEDHEHCCPSGYTCDVTQGSCTKNDYAIPWTTKRAAPFTGALRSEAVPCDESHFCPDDGTCCRNTADTWSCCSLSQAVCCSDLIHCCPFGYTCNIADGTCIEGNSKVPWLTKSAARLKEETTVPCDETTSCPKDSTCCRSDSNDWACCPLLEAVCCSDLVHCCPYGYTCNVADGTCIEGNNKVPWLTKSAARLKEETTVACDETTSCPKDSTCCRSDSNDWACCPLLEAVCCIDGRHCCPSGYRCVGDSCEQALRWDNKSSRSVKMNIL